MFELLVGNIIDSIVLKAGVFAPSDMVIVEMPNGQRKFVPRGEFFRPISQLFVREDGVEDPVFRALLPYFSHPRMVAGKVAEFTQDHFRGVHEVAVATLIIKLQRLGLDLGCKLITPTWEKIERNIMENADRSSLGRDH